MVRVPSRPTLTIALGVLLLVNPLYVDALHLDQPNRYRYESAEVTYGPDGIDSTDDALVEGIDDDIACLADSHPSRACAFEIAVHERGNLSIPVSWGYFISEYGPLGYKYVYLNDSFYATEEREVGERTVLSLNRTPGDEALADVATPLSHASRPIRQAVRTGSVETRHELDGANQLLRDGDTYYVVYEAEAHIYGEKSYREKVQSGCVLETGLTLLGIAIGLLLVLRGQRRRIEHEW